MPAELPRTSLDNVLIKLVEGMVYSSEPHEQYIPRGSRSKKTLTFRQLLFESENKERDVTEHMGAVGLTVDGHKLAYIDGRISDDGSKSNNNSSKGNSNSQQQLATASNS